MAHGTGFLQGTHDDRAGVASPAVIRKSPDVLDLRRAAVGVEVGRADRNPVHHCCKMARLPCGGHQAIGFSHLANDFLARLGEPFAQDALSDRSEGFALDLSDVARVHGPVGLAARNHEEVRVRLPAQRVESFLQPASLCFVEDDDAAMADPCFPLEALGLCRDLLRRRAGPLHPKGVQRPDERKRVVEDGRAEGRGDHPLGGGVAQGFFKGHRPRELTRHRGVRSGVRACRARRCRDGKRGTPSSR